MHNSLLQELAVAIFNHLNGVPTKKESLVPQAVTSDDDVAAWENSELLPPIEIQEWILNRKQQHLPQARRVDAVSGARQLVRRVV